MIIEWSQADRTWLRTQLSQPSGQKLLAILRGSIPKLETSKLNRESAWIKAVEKQGEENMLDRLLSYSEERAWEVPETKPIDLTKEGD